MCTQYFQWNNSIEVTLTSNSHQNHLNWQLEIDLIDSIVESASESMAIGKINRMHLHFGKMCDRFCAIRQRTEICIYAFHIVSAFGRAMHLMTSWMNQNPNWHFGKFNGHISLRIGLLTIARQRLMAEINFFCSVCILCLNIWLWRRPLASVTSKRQILIAL